MAQTHHPVRLFRLSCGCLREYPMMPAGIEHTVLCTSHRKGVTTVLAYPERACGVTAWCTRPDGARLRVSCTNPPGTCVLGLHWDTCALAYFSRQLAVVFTPEVYSLAAQREGKVGRA